MNLESKVNKKYNRTPFLVVTCVQRRLLCVLKDSFVNSFVNPRMHKREGRPNIKS